ncbi:hypothetical protein BGZ95_001733 [Linnemannia exigua]|uniref:F-box domain-containing protein n=1 Tax=Linnemannia exigua TaxID=604196 RepID=A0AAD4D721_9FUNG|nr:hypothetical protein BGZ95_001733 [Linnemannia exigua]
MNQHRLLREICWVDNTNKLTNNSIDKAVARLPRATQLVWSSTDSSLQEKHTQRLIQALRVNNDHYLQNFQSNAADSIVHNIQANRNNNSNADNSNNKLLSRWKSGLLKSLDKAPLSKGVLRELDLSGPAPLFTRILPYLRSLTVLRLHLHWSETIQVHALLSACPHLLSLHVDAPSAFSLPGSWKPSIGTVLGVEPINQNGILPLQSLTLENACFAQTSLEDLLVLTPHLARLQLRNLREDATAADGSSYSWSDLFHHLTTLSLPLRSIHFSVYGQVMSTEEEQERVLMVCPRTSEWSFRSFDFTPTLVSCLLQTPNRVTTLELIASEGQGFNDYGLALHRFLCVSPHLLHLIATNSVCLIERMDLHQRWTPSIRRPNGVSKQDLQPGIWACRNLRTLRVRVHNFGSAKLQPMPLRSRIVYGYISEVLPQLRELELFELENDPGLNITLYGGLCLLSRLRHLESFRLGTGKTSQQVRPGDVRWMIPSGQSRVGRMERMETTALWTGLLDAERQSEAKRQDTVPAYTALDAERQAEDNCQDNVPAYSPLDDLANAEPQLVKRLASLGLLSGVKALVDQMNSKEGYECWPSLKYLSVFQEGRSPRSKTSLEKGFERLVKKNSLAVDSRVNDDTALIMGAKVTDTFFSTNSSDR